MAKYIVGLDTAALEKEQEARKISSDMQLATLFWCFCNSVVASKLPIDDERYHSPGPTFIVGVIGAFGGPFEKYFLNKIVRARDNLSDARHFNA